MTEHRVSSLEISDLAALGFLIDSTGGQAAEEFINLHFTGFNLLHFAEETEKHLKPVAEDTLVKTITLKDEISPKLAILYYTVNVSDPDHRLIFKRTFIREQDSLMVTHDFLSLPRAARGKRIGRRVLQFCLQHYVAMNVNKIVIHAALDDGGYEWTKAGFRATEPEEMKKILDHANRGLMPAQYNLVKRLYDDYYLTNPTGRAFPIIEWSGLPFMKQILRENDWHGEIDLTNSTDLFNFSEYVNG